MRYITRFRLCLAATILIISAAGAAGAQPIVTDSLPKQLRRGAVGIKAGIMNVGRIDFDGKELDPNNAACGEVFFDIPLIGNTMISAAADFYDIRLLSVSERYIDISLGPKVYFYNPRQNLAMRFGFMTGLGYLADIEVFRPSTYLTLKAFTELMLFPRGNHAWVFDFGWWMAPAGGWDDHDVTFGSSLYLRAGVAF